MVDRDPDTSGSHLHAYARPPRRGYAIRVDRIRAQHLASHVSSRQRAPLTLGHRDWPPADVETHYSPASRRLGEVEFM
jgi:hypothetical protein